MSVDDPSISDMTLGGLAAPGGSVPDISEVDMWTAELSYLPPDSPALRSAQFAIWSAMRAQSHARLWGTNPVDELLDGRSSATNERARQMFDLAIRFIQAEAVLDRAMRTWHLGL